MTLLTMPFLYLSEQYQGFGLPKALLLQVVLLILAGCCLWRGVGLPRAPFVLPLMVFLGISALQSMRSLNPSNGLMLLSLQAGGSLLALVTASLVPAHQVGSLVRFSAVAGIGIACMGMLEYLGVSWVMLTSAGRPSVSFGFRNIAAMYLVLNLPLSATLLFGQHRWDRFLGTAAVFGMAVFLVFTRTRAAWVGLAGGLVVGGMVAYKIRSQSGRTFWELLGSRATRWQKAVGLALLVFVAGLGHLRPAFQDASSHRLDEKKTTVTQTVVSIVQPGGDRGRFRTWMHTLEMIWDHPVVGVGLDNWSVYFLKYDGGDVAGIKVAPKRPHNDFLWIWSELGTVGLGVYLWLLWGVGQTIWGRVCRGDEGAIPVFFIGIGLLAILGQSFFSFPREQASVWMLVGIMLGVAGRSTGQERAVGWATGGGSFVIILVALGGIWLCVQAIRFDAHFTRSLMAQDMGRSKIQVKEAEAALQYGLFDHRVYLLLGQGRFQEREYDGAVEAYRAYVSYQPFLPALHNNLGQAYEAMGDLDAAKASYERGLETFSGDGVGVLHAHLAGIYKKQGDVGRALAIYRDAEPVLKAPGLHNLGLAYTEKRMFDEALAAYKKALAIDGDLVEIYFSLAGLYLLRNELEQSAATYETFLSRWTGIQDYVRDAEKRLRELYPVLSDRYLARGDLVRAEQAYLRLEALGAATSEVYHNLALMYRRKGSLAGALEACRKALALDPDFGQAYFTLARLLDESGDREGAVLNFRAFLERWNQNDRLTEEAQRRVQQLEK